MTMKQIDEEKTYKYVSSQVKSLTGTTHVLDDSGKVASDLFATLEETLDRVAEQNPRLAAEKSEDGSAVRMTDLKALLQVSLAINSSLVLDDVLQMVMQQAIELMQAERGLIMLLDDNGELQTKSAYNLCREQMMEEDFRISSSITNQVARTGKSVYTSDALADDRYAQQQSVVELHLRSIMCVPLTVNSKVIGVIYLDNTNQARMFLKSDLYLFELYGQLVSNALHNAAMYNSLNTMKRYNESVVKNTPTGIVVLNAKGCIATINPVALEIFDLNRDSIVRVGEDARPTVFVDRLPAGEQHRWRKMITDALVTKQELAEPRYFHNTGYIEKVLSIKFSPVSGLPDGTDGITMAIEDVTEKVLMEKYVILSEKLVARGEMAASVAHELNNYLSIISNNAELLSLNIDREKFDKVKFNSKSITENIFKIKRFVDSLMDFSKPEPEYISYDIRHLIDDLLFSLRVQPRFKLIHFTLDLATEMPSVEIDVGQVQQVLMNLLNNAADAIEEHAVRMQAENKEFKRQIGISAAYDRVLERMAIEVTDNGIGMSEETLGKLFNLHFTTKKHGHGLGLYNCRKIVEQHGGELLVSSKIGDGTTFKLFLPRLQPKKAK
ncbi:MAG: ATP-binding protein [candidate division Zixibacteria bacterium]|nr:ATP-binding protein [candidate division Zixibacteria bacterium]